MLIEFALLEIWDMKTIVTSDLRDKYDEIKIYEGGRLDYYLANISVH